MVNVSEMRNVQEATPRLPSWRIDRARVIIDKQEGRWHPNQDDDLIISSVKYFAHQSQLAGSKLNDTQIAMVLARHHEPEFAAERLSADPHRFVIDARLLAGQSDEEIAHEFGTITEGVKRYEQLYFNVRDRLNQQDYIHHYVIGPAFRHGIELVSRETQAKYVGYVFGSAVLDLFLYGPLRRAHPRTGEEILAYFDNTIENMTKLHALNQLLSVSLSKYDTRTILETQIAFQRLNQSTDIAQEQASWVTSLVDLVRKKTPIPRGAEADNIPADSPLRNYSAGQVELRAEEQLRAASKGGLPYLAALENFRLHRPEDIESSGGR